jgi:hypothetical protein
MAPFDFDGTGIDPDSKGTNRLLPKRWHSLEIVEFQSRAGETYPLEGFTKNKDPMVNILCEVVDDPEFEGERVFHTVTFLPKDKPGSGMAIHWLKTIGQPWEGKFSVDSKAWVGERFMGYIINEEYNGKMKNKISEVKLYEPKKDGVPY